MVNDGRISSSIDGESQEVRHGPHLEPRVIRPLGGGRWEVTLENPDQRIAPGQSAIFYDGEICLGGGVIE
jgi:tRNA U34 2-thiouridine synthase MnmA/TrmU